MVKFEGKIGTLYTNIFNAQKRFLKNSPHDVQIKGGEEGQRPFEQC